MYERGRWLDVTRVANQMRWGCAGYDCCGSGCGTAVLDMTAGKEVHLRQIYCLVIYTQLKNFDSVTRSVTAAAVNVRRAACQHGAHGPAPKVRIRFARASGIRVGFILVLAWSRV